MRDALVARWLAVIVMLGLFALVLVTNHTPCAPYGLWHTLKSIAGEDAKRRSPPPSSSPIGVVDQGGGISSDRACEVDPVPSRVLLFVMGRRGSG